MNTYIFDFDGTLVDSMPAYTKAIAKILTENGIDYDENLMEIITPLGPLLTAKYLCTHFPLSMGEDALYAKILKILAHVYCTEVTAKPNAKEALLRLKGTGHPLFILTASPREHVRSCLLHLGLYDLFEQILSCEEFGMGKERPAIFRLVTKRLNVSAKDTVFIDDNLTACRAAKEAGLTVYAVRDLTNASVTAELMATADRYLFDFSEL